MSDKKECPTCAKRGKPCESFVSGNHVFEHYGIELPEKRGDLIILSRYPRRLP